VHEAGFGVVLALCHAVKQNAPPNSRPSLLLFSSHCGVYLGSAFQIYNEEVRDLLGADTAAKLSLKEDPGRGVFVKDLSEEVVKDVQSINTVMDRGFQNRTVGATLMNAGSSRSHSIFTVVVEANETVPGGKDRLRAGKLNLVDLAGSERQSKTGATGAQVTTTAFGPLCLSCGP